jgi:hypothetical protein
MYIIRCRLSRFEDVVTWVRNQVCVAIPIDTGVVLWRYSTRLAAWTVEAGTELSFQEKCYGHRRAWYTSYIYTDTYIELWA